MAKPARNIGRSVAREPRQNASPFQPLFLLFSLLFPAIRPFSSPFHPLAFIHREGQRLIRFYAGNGLFLIGSANRQLSVRLFRTAFRPASSLRRRRRRRPLPCLRLPSANCVTRNCSVLSLSRQLRLRWKINGRESGSIRNCPERTVIRGCPSGPRVVFHPTSRQSFL